MSRTKSVSKTTNRRFGTEDILPVLGYCSLSDVTLFETAFQVVEE
jgi:hypothetical protein